MKATKALLAIMAVAVMVIAPLAVASVDAEKTPTSDGQKGYYIVNNVDITDQMSMLAVLDDPSDMLSIFKDSTRYLNQDILDYTTSGWGTNLKILTMKVTTYQKDEYDSLNNMTDDTGGSTVIIGTFDILFTTTEAGKFFKEASDAADGDLMKEANKTFGDCKKGEKVQATLELTIKMLDKTVAKYEEAKNTYVVKSINYEEMFLVNSKATYMISEDKDKVNVEYNYKDIKSEVDTYENTVSKDSDAPAYSYWTANASDNIYDFVLKGKIADKEYSSSALEKEQKDEAKAYAESHTQTEKKYDITLTKDDINPANVTLSDVKIAALSAKGFTGANDAAKAKSDFDAVYNSLNVSSGSSSSGIPVWVWIIVAVAVIIVAVVVILLLKKNGKI